MIKLLCFFGHSWYPSPNLDRMDMEEKCKNCGAVRLSVEQKFHEKTEDGISIPPPRLQNSSGADITRIIIPYVPPKERTRIK